MKKLAITLFALLLIVATSVVALPYFVDVNAWVAKQVKIGVVAKTGRNINFSKLKATVWPNIGLKLKDVTISNSNWAKNNHLVSVGNLDVSLAFAPLLKRNIVFTTTVIDNPVINLEVDPSGRKNWELSKRDTSMHSSTPAGKVENKPQDMMFDISLGQLKITDAVISYADAQKGMYETISNADVVITWPRMNDPMSLKGGFVFRQKKVDADLKLVNLIDFINGKTTAGDINIEVGHTKIKAAGMFATKGKFVSANVEAKVDDVEGLVTWLDNKGQTKSIPVNKLYVAGEVQASKQNLALNKVNLVVDDIKASGDVKVAFRNIPDVYARLAVSKLDFDNLIKKDRDAIVTVSNETKTIEDKNWSRTPIDFSIFKNFNLDLVLKAEGFSLRDVHVGESDLIVNLKGGNFNFKSTEAKLLKGTFVSDLTLNAYSSVPTMAANFTMQDVKVNDIFAKLMNFDKLSGEADANVSVTSSGINQKEIISNLNGKGNVTFKNGSMEDIDLVNIATLIQKRILRMGVGKGKTDFMEVNSNFTIKDGVIYTNDIKLKAPLVEATGVGSIYLPKKYLDFKVTPALQVTVEKDQKLEDLLSVPVKIKGYFGKIKVKPQYRKVIEKIIAKPKAEVKAQVKDIKKEIKVIKKAIKEEIKEDPANAIKSLFGAMFGSKKEKSEEE